MNTIEQIREQIRAEIRQRVKKYGKLADAAWRKDDPFAAETNENIISELQSLIVFTYTLPEQPMMCSKDDYHWEGLKELLRDYQKTIDRQHNNMAYESVELYIEWIDSLFEQPASEGLEEAAYKYTNSEAAKSVGRAWLQRDVRLSFIAGAEWMKAKMLEGAVEGEVVKDINNKLGAVTAKNVNLDKFKFGDKVKILVIKDEGK